MFDSIGWVEIAVLLVVVLIVVGPERLPGLVTDVRAAVFAARKAINNAKAEMAGYGAEFDEIRKPIQQVAQYTAMGPKAAITKALLDGDETFFDDFDPRKKISTNPQNPGDAAKGNTAAGSTAAGNSAAGNTVPGNPAAPSPRPPERRGGTFNYAELYASDED